MIGFNSDFYKDEIDDNSIPPQRRESLKQPDWNEQEIDRTEDILMRHARIDRENAIAREKHNKYCEEWNRRTATELEAKRLEREKLGIEPIFKILYSSPDRVDTESMSAAQRRKFEMRGLDTEELLSQGYIDIDDLDNF